MVPFHQIRHAQKPIKTHSSALYQGKRGLIWINPYFTYGGVGRRKGRYILQHRHGVHFLFRSTSIIGLMPSPISPNTRLTSQAINLSIRISAVVNSCSATGLVSDTTGVNSLDDSFISNGAPDKAKAPEPASVACRINCRREDLLVLSITSVRTCNFGSWMLCTKWIAFRNQAGVRLQMWLQAAQHLRQVSRAIGLPYHKSVDAIITQ